MPERGVKLEKKEENGKPFFVVVVWTRCRDWMDRHPRTGWYFVVILTIDTILHFLQVFGAH